MYNEELKNDEYIYFGETREFTRGLGDTILLTACIREINKKFPNKKIIVRTLGPKCVFDNNPRIFKVEDGICGSEHGIRTYGIHQDSIPDGGGYFHIDENAKFSLSGHFIERKCKYFGINNPDIRPEIFISEKESEIAKETLKMLSPDKPSIVLCKNSTEYRRDWTLNNWINVVDMLNRKYNVFQVEENIKYDKLTGLPTRIMETVPNARQELRGLEIRKLMAILSVCKKYIGTNTGIMPMATAFGNDNIIFMHRSYGGDEAWMFPQNTHFFENQSLLDVKDLIYKKWIL